MKDKENFSKSLFRYTNKNNKDADQKDDSDMEDFKIPPLPKKKSKKNPIKTVALPETKTKRTY